MPCLGARHRLVARLLVVPDRAVAVRRCQLTGGLTGRSAGAVPGRPRRAGSGADHQSSFGCCPRAGTRSARISLLSWRVAPVDASRRSPQRDVLSQSAVDQLTFRYTQPASCQDHVLHRSVAQGQSGHAGRPVATTGRAHRPQCRPTGRRRRAPAVPQAMALCCARPDLSPSTTASAVEPRPATIIPPMAMMDT